MATTFLDLGALKTVEVIFPFILTWAVVFGLLEYRKVLGESKGLHSTIAFVFAIFVLLSPKVTAVIRLMAPWFLVILMLFMFSILLFKMFGLKDSVLEKMVSGESASEQLIWWIIIVSVVIFLASVGSVYFSNPVTGDGNVVVAGDGTVQDVGPGAFFETFFDPKILGMIFVMVIASFTIILLAGRSKQ